MKDYEMFEEEGGAMEFEAVNVERGLWEKSDADRRRIEHLESLHWQREGGKVALRGGESGLRLLSVDGTNAPPSVKPCLTSTVREAIDASIERALEDPEGEHR